MATIFLDPGGDAVQGVNYFATSFGTNPVTFDTSQKVNGIGSYKFDSGAGNEDCFNKVAGVLGASRRINFYFRYDSVPDTNGVDSQFTNSQVAYSGGGFTTPFNLQADDATYATATPAKNSAQGSTCSFPMAVVPADAIIDSIKVIYQRKYDTASSIGTSRVRYLVGAEEGPNHDNTDMPTTDTVVTVDITADRTWTHAEVNAIKVIAEALRGDTDTAHTQSWDYVRVEVEYHTAIDFLAGQETGGGSILRLYVLPAGSGMVLRLKDAGDFTFDGITVIPPNEWHRIALCFNQNDVDNLDVKLHVDAVEELSLVGRGTSGSGVGGWPDLVNGWIAQPGANQVCWVDQIYIDDVSDLSDPRSVNGKPIWMTAKLPATVNQNNFDTTGGTGAVNERPVNLANYRQQAGASQQFQNYTLQAADVGDVDLTGKTLIDTMGWVIAKRGSGPGSTGAGITVNGVHTNITLSAVGAGLHKAMVGSSSYPSNAAGIGLRSITTGGADAFLYECGAVIAYEGPPDDILFAYQEVAQDTTEEAIDDLSAAPPSTYAVRFWCYGSSTGRIRLKVYTKASAEASYQLREDFSDIQNETAGRIFINADVGVEVKVEITATLDNMSIGLAGYPNY